MQRFQNVLMIYPERHPEVMRQVARLLRQTAGRLTVVDALPDIASEIRWLPRGMPLEELERILARERQEAIAAQLTDDPNGRHGTFQVKLLRGKPAVAVIRETIRNRHDLVIKVATGESGLPGRLFGTMATKLMRKCPTPVWLVKPSERLMPARVLAAVDPMREHESDIDLNRRITDLAASIAAISGGAWEALHCWSVPGESLLSYGRTRIAPEDLLRLVKMTETLHRTRLEALMKAAPPNQKPSAVHLIKGEPAQIISDFVLKNKIDLVVMGTVSEPGVAGLLSGTTAERVLREADCSLMTVKPRGFVSPVIPDAAVKPANDRSGSIDG